jgi:acetyl-CoA carboxylase biotin carboxylase subunit
MAIARMRRALEAMIVEGVESTVSLHHKILADHDFVAGNFSTRYLDRFLASGKPRNAAVHSGD